MQEPDHEHWSALLTEWMQENDVDVHGLADRLHCRWAAAHRLVYDELPMNEVLALNLAHATGVPAGAWLLRGEGAWSQSSPPSRSDSS